jgi:hypothetical protein
MAEFQLALSASERDLLLRLLSTELKNTRVELHHTDFSPDFRQEVKDEEGLLRGLMAKLHSTGG